MKDKINIIIPDLFGIEVSANILMFHDTFEKCVKEGIKIFACYTKPICVWSNDYNKFKRYQCNKVFLENIVEAYQNMNLKQILYFDKEDINPNDLNDEYCNMLMGLFNKKDSYVICKSKKLETYIKENYTKVGIIGYSDNTNSSIDGLTLINENNNGNKDLFKCKDKNNFILYADGNLIGDRTWMFKHSINDSKLLRIDPKKNPYYSKKNKLSFYEMKSHENYLNYEKLCEYSKNGINYFMLSGVGVYNVASINNIIDIIFKDEYKADIRARLFQLLYNLKERECLSIYTYEI